MDEIPMGIDDPLEVFDATDVSKNVMRFVVYILWLKGQPDSFEGHLACQRTSLRSVERLRLQTLEVMKRKKPLSTGVLLARYHDPLKPGSLGRSTRFAKGNNILVKCT